jgi:hypothetical protein
MGSRFPCPYALPMFMRLRAKYALHDAFCGLSHTRCLTLHAISAIRELFISIIAVRIVVNFTDSKNNPQKAQKSWLVEQLFGTKSHFTFS